MDFRTLLSADQIRMIEREQMEIERLFHLSDRWLAEEILKMARAVRSVPDRKMDLSTHVDRRSYETSLVWGLIPEIAARLGASRFMPGERALEFRVLDSEGLRAWVGLCLKNAPFYAQSKKVGAEEPIDPWTLVTREVCNGNPIAFALDRVAPPSPASTDAIANSIAEVARRRGFEGVRAWTPELNRPKEDLGPDLPTPSFA